MRRPHEKGDRAPVEPDARFEAHAPFGPGEDLGPFRLRPGRGASALLGAPARLAAWREGLSRTPVALRPEVLADAGDAILLGPLAPLEDPRAALEALGRGPAAAVRGTRRAVLDALDPERRLARALGRLGLPRRDVDRYLDHAIEARARTIPVGFGGQGLRAWRRAGERPVMLRLDRAAPEGWLALERAALEADLEADLDAEDDPEVAALARLAVALGEAVRAGAPSRALAVAASLVTPAREPDRVRVRIDGPPVTAELWEPPGAEVDARRARWLLANLDGLSVAGGVVRVRTEPPIRAGRRATHREPRARRERRLFSRWDREVALDDEARVGLTPEALALAIAARAAGVVLDGTCGAGGLAIALARTASVARVIAVDRDAARLEVTRHYAARYGVAERIELVHGDVLEVLRARRADVLVLDPPWGGRDYDRARVPLDALGLDVATALERFGDGHVLLKLPRSFDPATLPGGPWQLELLLDEREQPKLLLAERPPRAGAQGQGCASFHASTDGKSPSGVS
ncbi:MAG: methyltransferase [Sandaracinaceae bacterium]|nr:methyltransferase [Sandaracinaceae bacterium]